VTIEDWRHRIDEIDRQILELLNHRAACAIEIGRLKQQQRRAIYSPEREEEVIARALQHNRGPLDERAIRRLFTIIIEESRRLEAQAAQHLETEDDRVDS